MFRAVQAVRFYVAVFLGAFLLFLVQPLMARRILPWFGGGSVVWASCLLSFQVALVAGYAYAHVSRAGSASRRQVSAARILLVIALFTLPITPAAAWKPDRRLPAPVSRVAVCADADRRCAVRAAGGNGADASGLVRASLSDGSPYRLYVLSERLVAVGARCLSALPRALPRSRPQAVVWSLGFGGFLIVCACARNQWRSDRGNRSRNRRTLTGADRRIDRLLWMILPAIGSGFLVATTSSLTQDVAAVPTIWIVPLALYPVTFILAFAGWYWRWAWGSALVLLLAAAVIYYQCGLGTTILIQGIALVAAFTAAAMVCHGELARRSSRAGAPDGLLSRPVDRRQPRCGVRHATGACCSSPGTSNCPCCSCSPSRRCSDWGAVSWRANIRGYWPQAGRRLHGGPDAYVGAIVFRPVQREGLVASGRGYCGMLRVFDEGTPPAKRMRKLWHGRIVHGVQALVPPELRRKAGWYYAPGSGIATAMGKHPRRDRSRAPQDRRRGPRLGDRRGARPAVHPHSLLRDRPARRTVLKVGAAPTSRTRKHGQRSRSATRDLPRARDGLRAGQHAYDVLGDRRLSGDAIGHLLTKKGIARSTSRRSGQTACSPFTSRTGTSICDRS